MRTCLAVLCLLLASCDTSGVEAPVIPPLGTPAIPGVFAVDEAGNSIGTIGNPRAGTRGNATCPDVPQDGPVEVSLYPPYPNPARLPSPDPPALPIMRLRFVLPCALDVSVWADRGTGPGEAGPGAPATVGGAVLKQGGALGERVVFLYDEPRSAAVYEIGLFFREPGYYRVYLQAGEALRWQDALVLPTDINF